MQMSGGLGRGFKMLEDLEDQGGGSQITIHGSKLAAWEQICMALRIVDTWHHPRFARERNGLAFSRFDRSIEG